MGEGAERIAREGSHPLSYLKSFGILNNSEILALMSIAGPARRIAKGEMIRTRRGTNSLDLLMKGWAGSVIPSSDGGRQLVGINLPGDLLGLAGLALLDPVEEVLAISDATVRPIPPIGLNRIFSDHPRLAGTFFLIALEERAFAMERLALMGHEPAKTRLAALLIRLSERATHLEPEQRDCFEFPLTQHDLADLIGVSTVYVNGIVQELRAENLIQLTRRELHILDYGRLLELAGVRRWRRASLNWLPPQKPG